ncbi:VanW family protein [Tessaracoccus sp. Y1736]
MKRATKIAIGVGTGAVVVLGGVYVASYFVAGNQVPVRASVEGVAIGGMSPEQAAETLRSELGPAVEAPIALTAGDVSVPLEPASIGLSADFEATVREAGGGFSWNPAEILATLAGGEEIALVRVVDEEALTDGVAAVADRFAVDGVDATLAFADGEVARTEAVEGQQLDVDATADAVEGAFLASQDTAEAATAAQPPAVTDAMVDEAVTAYAEPILSGPVTVTHKTASMEIAPAAIAGVTTFTVTDGKLVPVIDGEALSAVAEGAEKALGLNTAKDAGYRFTTGAPVVVPAVTGETLELDAFVEAVKTAATATGEARTFAATVTVEEPEFTTAEAEALAPTEVIGEYSTRFPYAAYRNTNLSQAANSVNGTVVLPGEIFSLNDTLGPRTAANGYVDGYVINGGRLVKEAGGGISQAATTLYNAGFFAGYEDVEHKPHSLYFDRYPAGREATIYYGVLDMRFRNDTKYPAIIQGSVTKASSGSRGTITFRIWSQRTYTKVESTELVKSGFYTGAERVVTETPCEPQAPIQGFTVTWQRLFYQGSEVVKRENYSWKYSAGDRITCG